MSSMVTKHTEGAWYISERPREENEFGSIAIEIDTEKINSICSIWKTDDDDETAEYDAKLIAASPILLSDLSLAVKRLKQLMGCAPLDENQIEILNQEIFEMEQAIKKATE